MFFETQCIYVRLENYFVRPIITSNDVEHLTELSVFVFYVSVDVIFCYSARIQLHN